MRYILYGAMIAMNNITYKKIYNTILAGNRFALIVHRKPDGDTIGSAVAFSLFLKKLGKESQFFCLDKPADSYHLLLKSAGALDFEVNQIDKIVDYKPSHVILFDCADWKQAGLPDEGTRKQLPFFISIDHHISNKGECDIKLIIPDASSTCEIVYNFYKENKIFITQQVATCLFMGLITDTGNFSNGATTNSSLFVASKLLLCGAKLKDTYDSFIRNQNVGMLKLWGIVFKRLKYSEEKSMVSCMIKLDDFEECGVGAESAEGISNFLRGSLSADVIIVYSECSDGFIKASIRSDGDFDAMEYAKKFGGGGHKKAAGFSTEGILKEGVDRWEIVDLKFLTPNS
ncbi:MAG: bifunctional oligoribonuclease/PAP phosphatase NrnA [Parcubacteria group bacterium]|nr:bifunctional oligoribonuclease/PAP phosphatase NrnA [Parcubacteria group bacterium]